MSRIKSLDGLRAISIIIVLITHIHASWPFRLPFVLNFLGNGALGVRVFFLISGYLITKLLIIEQNKTGGINFKKFYLRRVFRILPVFYLFLVVVLIMKLFIYPDLFKSYALFASAALNIWNYKHLFNIGYLAPGQTDNAYQVFGHFWSLAMEEQFYLLWPLAFLKLNRSKLVKITIAIIALMPVIRLATYFFMPNSRGQVGMMLHTGGDTILLGCLGALIESMPTLWPRFEKLLQSKFLIYIAAIFLFYIDHYLTARFKGMYVLPVGMTLSNLCILYIVFWCVHVPSGFSNILNSKYVIPIGVLSYSLYIWQQLFLLNDIKSPVTQFPLNIILTIVVAIASYHLFEKPILRYKARFKY